MHTTTKSLDFWVTWAWAWAWLTNVSHCNMGGKFNSKARASHSLFRDFFLIVSLGCSGLLSNIIIYTSNAVLEPTQLTRIIIGYKSDCILYHRYMGWMSMRISFDSLKNTVMWWIQLKCKRSFKKSTKMTNNLICDMNRTLCRICSSRRNSEFFPIWSD